MGTAVIGTGAKCIPFPVRVSPAAAFVDSLLSEASVVPGRMSSDAVVSYRVYEALAHLSPLYNEILKARFPADGNSPMGYAELALKLSLSRDPNLESHLIDECGRGAIRAHHVRDIEAKALRAAMIKNN